jgi:hypothetical protein
LEGQLVVSKPPFDLERGFFIGLRRNSFLP